MNKAFRLAIALAFAAFVVLVGPSSAIGADKPYSLVISNSDGSTPATLTGATEGTVRATYENLNTNQRLGSSNLVVPGELRIVSVSVSSGSFSISGNTIRLRDLNVPAGGTALVEMRLVPAVPACSTQSLTWAVPVTKQSNNFNGPPGNNLNIALSQSELRTVVTGSCQLRFITASQPKNAAINQSITAESYTPTGPPVAVEVVDSLGQRVPASGFSVTMSIGSNPGGGTLSGTKTVSTTDGVASFSTLSIDQPGAGYRLLASSAEAGSDLSAAFSIDEVGVNCEEDVDCTGGLAYSNTNQQFGGRSDISVTAIQGPLEDIDAGFLTLSRIGGPLDCSGYQELLAGSDTVAVNFSDDDREKRVVSTIDKKVMNQVPNNGVAFLEDCFGAPYAFATKPGTPLEVNSDYVPGPYPAPEYKGLLPDCGKGAVLDDPNLPGVQGTTIESAGPPCVEKRNKTQAGDGVISSIWPSGLAVGNGDPRRRV